MAFFQKTQSLERNGGPWGYESTWVGRFFQPGILQRLDFLILGTTAVLMIIGALFIGSASLSDLTPGESGLPSRQLQWIGLSVVVFLVVVLVPYIRLVRWSLVFYLGLLLILAYTMFFGEMKNNSRRWLPLVAGFGLQPSELAKPVLILVLAWILRYRHRPDSPRGLVIPLLMTGVPALLVAAQPDLATALLFFPIPLALSFVAGARMRSYFFVALVCLVALPPTYFFGLRDYQRDRIKEFVVPKDSDRMGGRYQVEQSMIMIGSGGFWGKGLGQGPQNRLDYLPERQTDFIFSVIGEEWGFVGCASVLLLFLLLVVSCLGVALRVREPCGRLIAVGVATSIAIPVFVNTAMTLGAAPTTGVPLPFLSYGGSSLLTHIMGIGLVMNVNLRRVPVLARGDFES